MSENTTANDSELFKALNDAKWWAIIARGALGFRFGPYSGEEAGKIMAQCVEEGILVLLSAECGREFDWDVARDFGRGSLAEYQPMEQAPRDGTEIIGVVSMTEILVSWSAIANAWSAIDAYGWASDVVIPTAWRPATPEDRARG